MYKHKNVDNIQNDKCLACHFCVWEEERQQYICDIKGCRNNSNFKIYKPSWMERDVDAANYNQC